MDIRSSIRALLPQLGVQQIKSDIIRVRTDVNTVTRDVYTKILASNGKNAAIKDPIFKAVDKAFDVSVRSAHKNGVLDTVNIGLKALVKQADVLEGIVEKNFKSYFMRDAATYVQDNALQYIGVMDFFDCYSRKLALHFLRNGKSDKRTEVYLNDNVANFANVAAILIKPPKFAKDAFKEMPSMIVKEENYSVVESNYGGSKIDPFGFGFIPNVIYPVYYYRIGLVRYKHYRHVKLQNEKKELEYHLMLKKVEDPKVVKNLKEQIDATQSELAKVDRKLAAIEEGEEDD